LAKGFVEVIHLRQDAANGHNRKGVGRGMRKLVVPVQRQLQGNTKSFDRHDRYRPNGRTDGYVYEWRFLSMPGSHLVDHYAGKDGNCSAVEQKPYRASIRHRQ